MCSQFKLIVKKKITIILKTHGCQTKDYYGHPLNKKQYISPMEKSAVIIKSGKKIKVYRSKIRGTWINSNDCTTEYQESEIRLT